VERVKKLLSTCLRVRVTDGRILEGIFCCFDKEKNIILADTIEYQPNKPTPSNPLPALDSPILVDGLKQRTLGLVLIPGRHIARCEAQRAYVDAEAT